MRGVCSWALLLAASPVVVVAAVAPPPFQLIRADETYGPAAQGGDYGMPPEPYKYLPLSRDGESYLSLGGEIRERFDSFDAPRFGIGTPSDAYDLQRILLHIDLHLGRRVRAFAQFGRHDVFGKRTAILPVDRSPADVQNLFVDVFADQAEHWRVRLGRQELLLNPTQRFISVREGPNFRLSYDGVRITWTQGSWRADGFSMRPVIVEPGAFENRGDPNSLFSGVYVSHEFGAARNVIDAYWLSLDRWNVRFGPSLGDERRRAIGARIALRGGPWDLEAEAMWQYGTFGTREIRAWGGGADGGFTFASRFEPRVGLRLDGASGGSATDPSGIRTFNPFFPKGLYFDESSLTTFANLLSVRPSLRITPTASSMLQVSEAWRWKQNLQDALYLVPFVPIPSTASTPGRYVGRWTIVDATWRANRWLAFQAEYVHVAAGAAVQSAHGHDVDFTMLIAQFRF